MGRVAKLWGVARSAGIYYGIPFRRRRLERFYADFVPTGTVCFDIGAHVGNRIRCWRALGARVVAVEPQQQCFRVLERLYGRDESVALLQCALGRAAGRTTLFVSERHPTVASVSADWIARVQADPSFADVEWNAAESVEMRTLDGLIAEYGEPAFIKIDVEGHEAAVLAGLSTPVRALSFECVPVARELALDCIARLSELGDYGYNYSRGESHRLALGEWLDARGIERFIAGLPEGSGSGDVYARRV